MPRPSSLPVDWAPTCSHFSYPRIVRRRSLSRRGESLSPLTHRKLASGCGQSRTSKLPRRGRSSSGTPAITGSSWCSKSSRRESRTRVTACAHSLTRLEAGQILRAGIHLVIVDLFPPGPRDPQGIHKAIWDDFIENDFALPSDRTLTLAS